jgi:integrase
MPRLLKSLPKYRKHKASGQAVVNLNGHDHYLGPHGTKASIREYDRLTGEWLENGRSLPSGQSHDITVAELLLRYWKFAKGYYRKNGKPTAEIDCLKSALRPLRELYGSSLAREFGPLALESVRQKMISRGWCRRVINQAVGRVRRVFRWAVSKELIPSDVYQSITTVDGLRKGRTEAHDNPPVAPVSDEVVEATLDCMPPVIADMVRLQRLTGMRPGEVCLVRPCDIDRSDDVWLYQPESHKTEHHGRNRIIPFGSRCQEILLRYLARDPEMYCFRPCDSEEKRRAQAQAKRGTSPRGKRPSEKRKLKRVPGEFYSTDSYGKSVKRACEKAFPHHELGYIVRPNFSDAEKKELRKWQTDHSWSPNQLRHSAGTEVRREFGLEAAQTVLGHANANTTQIYAERDVAKAIEVARAIG